MPRRVGLEVSRWLLWSLALGICCGVGEGFGFALSVFRELDMYGAFGKVLFVWRYILRRPW
jgi:hypothetical protein